jgi:membrane fusion protein (multidrug efflux system)
MPNPYYIRIAEVRIIDYYFMIRITRIIANIANIKGVSMVKLNDSHKTILYIVIILCTIIGIFFGAKWLIFRLSYIYTDDAQITGRLIPVSSKVAGKINKLYFDEGAAIKKDVLLAKIDDEDYKLDLLHAEAELEASQRDLEKEEAQLSLTEARVKSGITQANSSLSQSDENVKISIEEEKLQEETLNKEVNRAEINIKIAREKIIEEKSNFDNAAIEYNRAENLFKDNTISARERDKAKTTYETAKSKLEQATQGENDAQVSLELAKANLKLLSIKKRSTKIAEDTKNKAESGYDLAKSQKQEIAVVEKSITLLQAKIKELTAQVDLAKLHLEETNIYSPLDGIISKKISQNYEYVTPGKPIYIVNNPQDVYITANIEEAKINKIHVGAKVRIWIDAYPSKEFSGFVKSIGSAANSQFSLIPASNPSEQFIKIAQRIPITIDFDNIPELAKPGSMVEVAIK